MDLLLAYLYWLRDRVLAGAATLTPEAFLATPSLGGRDLRAILAHEVDVEMSWSGRLRGEPHEAWGPEAEVRPEHFADVASLRARWLEEERTLATWLAARSADRDAPMTVNGLDGRSLETYLLHVITHGLLELGGAAGLLHDVGRPLGDIGLTNALPDIDPTARIPSEARLDDSGQTL